MKLGSNGSQILKLWMIYVNAENLSSSSVMYSDNEFLTDIIECKVLGKRGRGIFNINNERLICQLNERFIIS